MKTPILFLCLLSLTVNCGENKQESNKTRDLKKIALIDAPSFSISTSDIVKMADDRMVDACPTMNVLGEEGPEICKKHVDKVTYFKQGDAIRFFACVGYSFYGAHWDAGQNGFVLAEYKNEKWDVVDFLQVHHDGNWGNSLEIQNQFLLGSTSYGYYGLSCGGGQGFEACTSYIIGFVDDKISILLEELSHEDNRASGVKPLVCVSTEYKPIRSENQHYAVQRTLFDGVNYTNSMLKFNPQKLLYE